MNNNHRNGKEVHKGQMPDNMQKEGNAKPVNRIKKKNIPADRDIIPGEPKKIPLNINKNTGNPQKNRQKGHVIRLEDKDTRIHPVETTTRENRRPHPKPQPVSDNRNTISVEPHVQKVRTDSNQPGKAQKESFALAGNTGRWLLIAAVVLFIAWAVIFFYYKIGGNSHMLLALAALCAIVSLAGRRK